MAAAAADSLPPLPILLTPQEEALKSAYLAPLLVNSVRSEILLGAPPLDLSSIEAITDQPEGSSILRIYLLAIKLLKATPANALPLVKSLFEAHVPNNWMENPATPVAWAVTLQTLQWQGVLLAALNKGDPEFLRTLLHSPSLKHLLPQDPYSSKVFDVLLMADLDPDMRHQLMKVVVEGLSNSPINLGSLQKTTKHYQKIFESSEATNPILVARFLGILIRIDLETSDGGVLSYLEGDVKIMFNILESIWLPDGPGNALLYNNTLFLRIGREILYKDPDKNHYSFLKLTEESLALSNFASSNFIWCLVCAKEMLEQQQSDASKQIPPEEPPAKRRCPDNSGAAAAAAANS